MSTLPLKTAARALLRLPQATRLLSPLMRGKALIFMLHRLEDREHGIRGRDPAILRRALAELRRQRFAILDLEELFERLRGDGPAVDRAVAFTVDDGTHDTATVAAPLFAEYDCPATVFLVSGYLDGSTWLWWDKIEHIIRVTQRPTLDLSVGPARVRYAVRDACARAEATADFIERCKEVSNPQRLAAIDALAEAAEVAVVGAPPAAYAPMTWDQARACEKRGIRFGPHTVTHPLLSSLSDEASRWEIEESWRRVSSELVAPTPVFCYPNGRRADFGPRELETMGRVGVRGGVAGVPPGYASRGEVSDDPSAIYWVPRLDLPEDPGRLATMLAGLSGIGERARGYVRRFT